MTKTRDSKKISANCKMLSIFVVIKLDFPFLRTIRFCMHSLSFDLQTHAILVDINTDNTPPICEPLIPQSVSKSPKITCHSVVVWMLDSVKKGN
jgi:hypothetical protein